MNKVASVIAVCINPRHSFSKQPQASIRLLAGQGVEGDAHCGATVQHIYLKRRNPRAPNLMQVHLIHSELLDKLAVAGFEIKPGQLGENITTRNIDLLDLPLGTRLHLGDGAIVELTGLRSPCQQIERFRPGLLKQVVDRDSANRMLSKAGVMSVVVKGGNVAANTNVQVSLPPTPHIALTII
jgi:MOSC domain-containing protein YiiM